MVTTLPTRTGDQEPPVPPPSAGWTHWAVPAAGSWSLLYAVLNLFWAAGGPGFPFGIDHDPMANVSLLAEVDRAGAAPVIAVLCLVGVAVALVMARPVRRAAGVRWSLMAAAVLAAVTLAVVIPDFRVLATVAYVPVLLVAALFGWAEGASLGDQLHWPVLNQVVVIAGGSMWAAAAVAYHRRQRDACPHCGRGEHSVSWTTPAAAARWGRWAVAVAVAVPLGYAATRFAWALGIPLGIDQRLLDELGPAVYAGAGLATLAVGGAVLTLGLVQRWGEVFPRWIPAWRGRMVPVGLAVVPAGIVSVILASAGVMFVRFAVTGGFGANFPGENDDIAAWLPETFWPLWAVALAAATYAYWLRRRGPCPRCERGDDEARPGPGEQRLHPTGPAVEA